MSEGEDQEKKDLRKGFAGLSSMVSDVDGTLVPSKHHTAAPKAPNPRPSRAEADPEPEPLPYQAPPQPSGGSVVGKWLLGIGAAVFVLWLISQSGEKTSPPAPAYTQSESPRTAATPSPTWQPPVAPPQLPSRSAEDRPPVGTANVLSAAQIRYCLAEDIRMIAAKAVISGYNESDVDRFNGMVADYNSRCSSFKYRRGALETARSEVESSRADLEIEGRGRFMQEAPKRRPKVSGVEGPPRDSVASALTAKDSEVQPPQFSDEDSRNRYERWLEKTGPHLTAIADQATRQEFLRVVWYESTRAGLDPNLVLGLVQVVSAYRKYAISESGARGYMQVATRWADEIGDGDPAKLFHMQANLRFGCVLLLHFQDSENGDLRAALRAYHEQADGRFANLPKASSASFAQMVLKARSNWASRAVDAADTPDKSPLLASRGGMPTSATNELAVPAATAIQQEGRPSPLREQGTARPSDTQPPGAAVTSGSAGRSTPSDATASEQAAIERACETNRRVSGEVVVLPPYFRTRSIRNVAPVIRVERGAFAQPVAA